VYDARLGKTIGEIKTGEIMKKLLFVLGAILIPGISNAALKVSAGGSDGTGNWTASGSSNTYVGGNVGVGTTTPAAALDVQGALNVSGGATFTGTVSQITATNPDQNFLINTTTAVVVNASSTTIHGSELVDSTMVVTGQNLSGTATNAFQVIGATFNVAANGFIGIGTTLPTQRIAVAGGLSVQNTVVVASSGSATAQYQIGCNANGGISGGYCITGTGSGSVSPWELQMNGSIIGNMNSAGQLKLGDSTAATALNRLDLAGSVRIASSTFSTSYTFTGSTATGAGTPTMGTNSPATVATPTYWLKIYVSTDAAPSYIPVWR
jgi:hypothetical protein